MTSIRQLVTNGFREAGIVEVGGVPDAAEFEEALTLLQGLYSSFFGNELGEQLSSVSYGSNGVTNYYGTSTDLSCYIDSSYVPTNVRLVLNVSGAKTLHLCPNPMDGARLGVIDNSGNLASNPVTLDGNGRQIENLSSLVLNTNSLNREWFYRADLGDWTKVTDLVAEDISPLPREFDDLLSTALAIRINPRYGATTDQSTADILIRARRQFRARYRQNVQVGSEDGLVRLTGNPRWPLLPGRLNLFNRGR